MSKLPTITISKSIPALKAGQNGAIVFLFADKGKLPASAASHDGDKRLSDAIRIAGFKGEHAKKVEILAPGSGLDRIVVLGIGKIAEADEDAWMKLGGMVMAATGKSTRVTVMTDLAGKDGALSPGAVGAMAAGAKLRAYAFDAYKTKDKEKPVTDKKITFVTDAEASAKKAWKEMDAVSDGVILARNLVNEPANILGPLEFAQRASGLKKLGCQVDILDEKKLKTEKMGALLGVAQGSVRPARVAIIQWNGGKANAKPVAFVGKGVVFDSGGISIKPAGGMEDMKGDMGGAAAVCGVMHALAARKAKVNAVGIIGIVENMPDGNAQRPGDIVTSRSGQTIEVINTDAEGRLVLADLLDYCEEKFKPQFMVNLATLTGAIIIALGDLHAGLFSNNDKLSTQLTKAGLDTKERVWRMPLASEYDKLMDSKNADMKNTGGRHAGSITAAQFLQRFVKNTPWAHLDIAGTAMGSPKNEYSQGWASGYGVRLLNRLVANDYE
jgi:leucyl aminopeptidase